MRYWLVKVLMEFGEHKAALATWVFKAKDLDSLRTKVGHFLANFYNDGGAESCSIEPSPFKAFGQRYVFELTGTRLTPVKAVQLRTLKDVVEELLIS